MQFMTLIFLYPIYNVIISLQIMNSAKSSILGPSHLNHSLHFAHLSSFVFVWIVLWNLFNKYLLSNYFEQGSGPSITEEGRRGYEDLITTCSLLLKD